MRTKTMIALVALAFSVCCHAVTEPEGRDGSEVEQQRIRSGLAEILGVPEKSVSNLEYLRQYFLKRIELKTPQAETREKIRKIFSVGSRGVVVDLEFTDRRDSVSISCRGEQYVFREVFDFFYDEDRRFTKFFGTFVTEPISFYEGEKREREKGRDAETDVSSSE